MQKLVYKPASSWLEYADFQLLWKLLRSSSFVSIRQHVAYYFKHKRLQQLMEFPILFLGALPQQTPSLYSLMNYADIVLGTWYPMGCMHKIVEAMILVAKENGVEIRYNCEAKHISVSRSHAQSIHSSQGKLSADVIVCSADYQHGESLLPKEYRTYRQTYWQRRKMALSVLIYYICLSKRLSGLRHHNLFFDTDFDTHLSSIYDQPSWPSSPLFYAYVPSQTDTSVVPQSCENIFLLIPVAAGLVDNEKIRATYYELLLDRLEQHTREEIHPYVVYKRSYSLNDFETYYHAYKGNAYGLANTLSQTAVSKPSLRSKRLRNLFFCGHLTTPGPGVPPSIISGQVVAQQVQKYYP